MWKDNLNIDVKLRNEDKSVALQTKADGKYDISLSGWSAGYYDASQMRNSLSLIPAVMRSGDMRSIRAHPMIIF